MLFLVLVLGLTYLYLNTDSGKRLVTQKVQSFLMKKLKTNFTIGSINYHLPNEITLSKIYLPSPNNDSLLYAGKLSVHIALFKLIKGETEIKIIEIRDAFFYIFRKENDSNFNFQFVKYAFANNKKKDPSIKDTAVLKLNLHQVVLNHVTMKLDDDFAGSSIYARLDSLELKMKTFKPDKLSFTIKSLHANGIIFNSVVTKHTTVEKDNKPSTNYLKLDAHNVNLIKLILAVAFIAGKT
jgi:hypothetical protein